MIIMIWYVVLFSLIMGVILGILIYSNYKLDSRESYTKEKLAKEYIENYTEESVDYDILNN